MKKHFIPLVILSLITAMLFTSCSNENPPSASSQILQSAPASETAGALNTSLPARRRTKPALCKSPQASCW